jgi:hypothetical protein
MAPPLMAREGATYLKRAKLRSESHHMRPGGFPGAERCVTPTFFYKNNFFLEIGVHIKMHIKL